MINAVSGTPLNPQTPPPVGGLNPVMPPPPPMAQPQPMGQPAASQAAPSFDHVVAQIKQESGGVLPPPPTSYQPKKKNSLKMILAGVVLLILIVGGGIGYLLMSQNTELRQQAAGNRGIACGSACTTSADCVSGNQCQGNKCVLTTCALNPSQCSEDLCRPIGANCLQVITPARNSQTQECRMFANSCDIPQGWVPDSSCRAETATNPAVCSLGFTVAAPTGGMNCQKIAYRDELSNSAGQYTLTQQQSSFQPGDTVVFEVKLQNTSNQALQIPFQDPLTENSLDKLTFLDSNCGANAYNSSNRLLSCPAVSVAAGATVSRVFRARIASNTVNGTVIKNSVNSTVGDLGTSCNIDITVSTLSTPTPTPTPTPTYGCNTNCTADSQCQGVNGGYVCASEYGNVCRLNSNRGSTNCTTSTTFACNSSCTSNADCQSVNASYICIDADGAKACRLDTNPNSTTCQSTTTTTVVGCNQTCASNADCASSDQICVSTDQGQVCRLAVNPGSSTCSPSTTTTTTTDTTTTAISAQPQQPSQLPTAGPREDVLKFLGIGAGVLILGAIGLLLL